MVFLIANQQPLLIGKEVTSITFACFHQTWDCLNGNYIITEKPRGNFFTSEH